MANKYENIGLLASLLGVINFYILVYHNYQEQDTSSLAPLWLLISSLIQILWFIYGYVNKLIPVYITSPLILLGMFYLVYLKWKLEVYHPNKERYNNNSELMLSSFSAI